MLEFHSTSDLENNQRLRPEIRFVSWEAWFLLACMLLGLACNASAEEAGQTSYRFGVVPQFSQRHLFEVWEPIIREVEKRSGVALKFDPPLTIPEFEKRLSNGTDDFVYANPYQALKAGLAQGYLPLVRDKRMLQGILVVRADSDVTHPQQLAGLELAVPSANALGASMLPQTELLQKFGVRLGVRAVQTHSAVYLNVLTRQIAVGGGVQKTFEEQPPAVQQGLKIIYRTREMPPHPVAAHPRVPAPVRQKVETAFSSISDDPPYATLLHGIPVRTLVETSLDDYLVMRDWGLDEFWREPQ